MTKIVPAGRSLMIAAFSLVLTQFPFQASAQQTSISDYVLFGGGPGCKGDCGVQTASSTVLQNGGAVGSYNSITAGQNF
ncbi:MAG: hypothetical protein KGM98_12155, partial [Bacteroidota bacterium]|nr:hypothetical protein [Bacteroidota bacterium]